MKRVTLFIIIVCTALCHAQTYNISGVVKNSAGNGIEGATVRLGQAGISTTTGAGGNFTLTGVGVAFRTGNAISSMHGPEILRDGRLSFIAVHNGEARVIVYDCNGRLQLSLREVTSSGNNMLSLPRLADGMHIYRVTVDDRLYTFKSVAGIGANSCPVAARKASFAARLAKTASPFDDALLAVKEGYQLYRLGITNPDTSGIQITLIPLVTGTVTDIDGIVYQTVQIGSQVWTMENLRTTKYNDGTPITKVTDNAAWNTLTEAYCFYNNSTDAAYQQKWGALYNWYAVSSGKLAPAGWRIPMMADWDTLLIYLSAHGYSYDGIINGSVVAKALAAKTDWLETTTAGDVGNNLTQNNSSGFSALPGGCRISNGDFDGLNSSFYLWTPEEFDDGTMVMAWYHSLSNSFSGMIRFPTTKNCGFSVRLVKEN